MNAPQIATTLEAIEFYKVNPYVFNFFSVFNLIICVGIICIFGVIGNLCNIYNFYRQRLNDSITVTLTALSVSDLGFLVFQQGISILSFPYLARLDLDVDPLDLINIFFFYPQGYFIRASGLITTFAAFERCMCVTMPLKVRSIFTRRLALIVNILICLILLLYMFPPAYTVQLAFKIDPRTNKTSLKRNNVDQVFQVNYLVADLALPYFTILALVVCNIIIIVTLKTKAKWRSTVSGLCKNDDYSWDTRKRERKTVGMLVTESDQHHCLYPPILGHVDRAQPVPRIEIRRTLTFRSHACYILLHMY